VAILAHSTGVLKLRHLSFIARGVPPRETCAMAAARDSEPNSQRDLAAARTRQVPAADAELGIALALGGGFSRGFAHLGILQVLEQEHVPISVIVGTSIGALLGAAYADGVSVRDLCDLGRRVRVRDFLRFRQSGEGAPRTDRISQFVEQWLCAANVEELRIPTAIVTTDLHTAAPYVFTSGPLAVALRASCAFPGLVKPVEFDGRMLADGCIAAPVPTATAARINGGCVLGVSVGSNLASASPSENIVKVLDPEFRSSHRIALEPSWSRHADILLEPQVHHIDWNDFSRVDEAFSAGVEAAHLALPAIRELLDRRFQQGRASGMRLRAAKALAV
jgi:NTE family protein